MPKVTAVEPALREALVTCFDQVSICGIAIDNVSKKEAVGRVDELVTRREPCYLFPLNVDVTMKIHADAHLRKLYRGASLIVVDGMPVVWASHWLSTPLKERVAGSDLFVLLCGLAAERGYRVYFLGARPRVAARAAQVMSEQFPHLQVAGTYSPPFGFDKDEEENKRIIGMLREAQPDLLFVGLGSPKQERWIGRFYKQYQVPVSMAVGASFDFAAGNVRRAPHWMQQVGLEWAWRLLMEPRRLWRRYLLENPLFFYLVWKQAVAKMSERRSRNS